MHFRLRSRGPGPRAEGSARESIETELQATDAAILAARIVADERARLGGQSLGLLRAAVEGMRSDAASARVELDERLIESVCERGRLAVTELRWLLGILRSESVADRPMKPPDLRGRVVDIAVAAALLVICVCEVWNQVWEPPTPLAWALAVVFPACVVVRRRYTALACSMAAAGVGAALLTGILPTVGNLFCMVLLAWSAGSAGRPVVWGISEQSPRVRPCGVPDMTPGTGNSRWRFSRCRHSQGSSGPVRTALPAPPQLTPTSCALSLMPVSNRPAARSDFASRASCTM